MKIKSKNYSFSSSFLLLFSFRKAILQVPTSRYRQTLESLSSVVGFIRLKNYSKSDGK